jgi:hypothetical protein
LLATIKHSLQRLPAVQPNDGITPRANLPGEQKKNIRLAQRQELNA